MTSSHTVPGTAVPVDGTDAFTGTSVQVCLDVPLDAVTTYAAGRPGDGTASDGAAVEDDALEDVDVPQQNPYPGPDKPEWTDRFSAALAAETGLPLEVAAGIAAFVVRPKDHLLVRRSGDVLKPGILSTLPTGHVVLEVRAHGFAGNAGEYNERIRSAYDSPAKPGARPDRVLPPLRTGTNGDGALAPFLTTVTPVPTDHVGNLLSLMGNALDKADEKRGYRLREDIEQHGQHTTTLHVALQRRILETSPHAPTAPTEPDGGEGAPSGYGAAPQERLVLDLTAITGSNRTRARLALFGLTPEDVVFGVSPYDALGIPVRTTTRRMVNAREWVPLFARLLQEAWTGQHGERAQKTAQRAQHIAVIRLRVIVGASDLRDFHTNVFEPNRVDHRRPPLDYALAERATSDMRALLRAYAQRGLLQEPERAWLAGEGADPAPVPGESVVDARDRRDLALLDRMFPPPGVGPDAVAAPLVRQVLGEPGRSQTVERHVSYRSRMYAAAASDGYQRRWNPRVLEGLFGSKTIREQRTWYGIPGWRESLARAAAGDVEALSTFVVTRGMLWLAERELVQADRGSVGAQTETPLAGAGGSYEDSDEAERARRIRRSMANVRDALLANPVRAVGLFRELADSVDPWRDVRQVDDNGEPIEETVAHRAWFDTAFPKPTGSRRSSRPGSSPVPLEPELQRPVSVHGRLTASRGAFLTAAHMLAVAAADLIRSGQELAASAEAAEQVALPDEHLPTVDFVERMLVAVIGDLELFPRALIGFKTEGALASLERMTRTAAFLEGEVAL